MLESDLRRRLLKIVGAFFLVEAVPRVSFAADAASTRRTFGVFLNVLLSADSYSGSASDLKVDQKLWAIARRDERFGRLIELGCQWLNMTGRGGFSDLATTDQITVVEWMSTSDWNEIPRRFYELVRQLAVEIYYSDPAALNGLSIQGPPQPMGYPPPWP